MTSIIDSCKNILEKHRVNIDNINNFNRVELGTICNQNMDLQLPQVKRQI